MENIDLKRMWQEANLQNQTGIGNQKSTEEIISMKHSKNIAKVLSDIKLKITLYSILLVVFAGLMFYGFAFLGLNLTLSTKLMFSMVGLFLLILATREIYRLYIFTKNGTVSTLMESQASFRKKLDRMLTIDFLSFLIFLYLLAIWVIFNYIQDIGGVKNLSGENGIKPMLLIFLVILLLSPWIIKYQNKQQYKKLYSDLNNPSNQI